MAGDQTEENREQLSDAAVVGHIKNWGLDPKIDRKVLQNAVVWVPLNAEPEARTLMQIVYLGRDSRKPGQGAGKLGTQTSETY